MSIQHKIEQNKGIKNDLWGIHLKKLKKKPKQNSSNIHMSTRDFKSFKLKMKLED